MTWRGGIACALAGLLSTASGCWTGGDGLTFLRFEVAGKGRAYVAQGSVATVSVNAQAALQRAGLFLSVQRDGDVVMLKSMTPSGQRFTLVLKGTRSSAGEQTQIRVEWENQPDEAFWAEFLAALYSIQTGSVAEPTQGTRP